MSPRAQAIRQRVYERLVGLGVWEPIDELLIGPLATLCDRYLSYREELRQAKEVDPSLVLEMAETHRLARLYLQDFLVIPAERLHLVPLNDRGDDADIAGLAGDPQ